MFLRVEHLYEPEPSLSVLTKFCVLVAVVKVPMLPRVHNPAFH